jgi:hypothetical protein
MPQEFGCANEKPSRVLNPDPGLEAISGTAIHQCTTLRRTESQSSSTNAYTAFIRIGSWSRHVNPMLGVSPKVYERSTTLGWVIYQSTWVLVAHRQSEDGAFGPFHSSWSHRMLSSITSPQSRKRHHLADSKRVTHAAILNAISDSGCRPETPLKTYQRLLQALRLGQTWGIRSGFRSTKSHTQDSAEAKGTCDWGFQ